MDTKRTTAHTSPLRPHSVRANSSPDAQGPLYPWKWSAGNPHEGQFNKVVSRGCYVGGVTHNLDLSDLEG